MKKRPYEERFFCHLILKMKFVKMLRMSLGVDDGRNILSMLG